MKTKNFNVYKSSSVHFYMQAQMNNCSPASVSRCIQDFGRGCKTMSLGMDVSRGRKRPSILPVGLRSSSFGLDTFAKNLTHLFGLAYSRQGTHFWVCITFCRVRHGDSVTKPDYYYYYYWERGANAPLQPSESAPELDGKPKLGAHQKFIPTFPWLDNCLMVPKQNFFENVANGD